MVMQQVFTWAIVVALVAGCTMPVQLVNARGDRASCGPFTLFGIASALGAPGREARCLADFQRQGYERAP